MAESKMNGNLKFITMLATVVVGVAVAWGAFHSDVTHNTEAIQELKDCKAEKDVIEKQFEHIDDKLNDIIHRLEKLDKK